MFNQLFQVPINNTYQVYVPPGDQTGLYYIPLANLPWETSWTQLKDHVRTVCSVERVEVFNESTSGWIMVRGRENFDRAYSLLSGKLFKGRPIFADNRNAMEPTAIKILAGSTLPKAASRTPFPYTAVSSSLPSQTVTDYGQVWTATPAYSTFASPTVNHIPYVLPATIVYTYGENRHWAPIQTPLLPTTSMGPYCEVGVYPSLQAYAHTNTGCDENAAFRGSAPSAEPRYDRRATHHPVRRSRDSGKHLREEQEKREHSKGSQDKKDKVGEVQSPSSSTLSLNYGVVIVDGSSTKR